MAFYLTREIGFTARSAELPQPYVVSNKREEYPGVIPLCLHGGAEFPRPENTIRSAPITGSAIAHQLLADNITSTRIRRRILSRLYIAPRSGLS